MSAFWRMARQLLKMKDDFEAQAANPLTRMWFSSRKNARRLTMVSIVAETGVLVPGLYDYDVAHIFDNAIGSYVNYIHTVKSTWIRLGAWSSVTIVGSIAANARNDAFEPSPARRIHVDLTV